LCSSHQKYQKKNKTRGFLGQANVYWTKNINLNVFCLLRLPIVKFFVLSNVR
jgi:hypothetical protein